MEDFILSFPCGGKFVIFQVILAIGLWCSCTHGCCMEVINSDESTAIGAVIDQLPPLSENFEYSMYEEGDPDGMSLFSVNKNGEIILKSQLNYDVDQANLASINVIKRKKGQKYGGTVFTREIQISDSNNHSPKFAKKIYHGSIAEGLPPGSIVKGLEDCYATDMDSSGISDYTITAGNNNDEFMLDVQELKGIKLLVVKTRSVLDRDRIRSTPYLDLEVQANDGGEGDNQKFDKTVIRIKIEDINDNPPVFIYSNWRRSIQENSLVMSSVMKISASDNDEGQNAEVYYRFQDHVDNFYIHPSTGIIGVAFPLNARDKNSYEMTVIAQDKSVLYPKSSKAYVSLQVIDIPQYPHVKPSSHISPKFLQKTSTVTIRADLPVMSFIYLAVLRNVEKYAGHPLTYSMTGAQSRFFHISPRTGIITLRQALNRLVSTKMTYKLYISVENGAKDSDTAVLAVNVQPLNLNMHSPVFSQSTVSIEISQSINVNTEIGYSVSAIDDDEGENGRVTYRIVGGTGIGYFHVDSVSGVLTTGVQFKNIGVYDLYIRATDSGLYRRYSTMYVRIKVLYGFDTPPVIAQAMSKCYIPENAESGSFIGMVYAKSPVPGRKITYALSSSEKMRGIAVDRDTGVITTTQALDYELGKSIFMEIAINVEGSSQAYTTALLVNLMNENDNPPVFTRPSVTVHVAENSGELDSLVCLFATDEDGIAEFPLKYSITKGNIDNAFSIDPVTGQLSAKNLDYETRKSYNLVVEASDGKSSARALVNVIVADTDDPPSFDRYEFTTVLDEGAVEKTLVKKLVVTGDTSGSHVCSWDYEEITPEILRLFKLLTEPEACVVEVKSKKAIVWQKGASEFRLPIRAVNKNKRNQFSKTSLNVKVRDVNTYPPAFNQDSYALSIVGEQKLGKSIVEVKSQDFDDGEQHGRITYDINDGADSSLFSIQPSGDIFVKSVLRTNREYVLTVNARKQGSVPLQASTTVRISVHDDNTELPKFAYVAPVISVLETQSISSIIFSVDAGSSNTAYKIVGGNIANVFQINRHGQVFLQGPLDYETVESYDLVIRATTPSVPPRYAEKVFHVKVEDVNDNAPVFAVEDPEGEMDIFVDRYSPKGTIVGKFLAFDRDSGENGIVSYTIPGSVPFTVGQKGTITTSREIGDPIGTEFKFNIIAMDNSKSTSRRASLRIKAMVKKGGKPPLFTQQVYRSSISDNSAIGTLLTTITTTDVNPMSTATFKVAGGDMADHFCIDATKQLSLKRPLDYDKANIEDGQLKIEVEMTYAHQSTLASILINVEDTNDNWPTFSGYDEVEVEVMEDAEIGSVVFTAKATDADHGQNGKVRYSITQIIGKGTSRDKFKINPKSGEVTVAASLNFEEAEEYDIIIKAQDNGDKVKKYAMQMLKVKIVDVNDKIPHFTESSYVGYIPTNANPGYQILKVYAVDFDSGVFGQVTYAISGSDYDGTFSIGKTSGIITLMKPIALLEIRDFQLNLVARDISKTGQVMVHLVAITMEGPPSFALRKFTYNVTENNNPSLTIGRIKGISLDSLHYSIVRGNTDNMFRIDPNTGQIYSVKKLDAEKGVRRVLYVRATDLSERFVETSVDINVINVNDNAPTFKSTSGLLEVIVPRSAGAGTKVVNVEAVDLDVGDKLRYEIQPAVARTFFKIDNTGTIYIAKPIRSLSIGSNQFNFFVIATDMKGASGKIKVQLTFVQLMPGAIIIREISELRQSLDGWFITDVPREYSSATYKIIYPSRHPFKIDPSSGYIGLRQSIDYEVTKQYVIIVEEVNTNKIQQYINYKVRIQLVDANDNRPKFTMKNFLGKVNKNAQPGTSVFKLTAEDADSGNAGRIVFEIKTLEVPFDIDPITSEIKTTSLVTLTQEWYNITVQASDRGIPPQVSDPIIISIKTGDNPPEFSSEIYEFQVSENAPAGKSIGAVHARSLSGINIQYSIESGDQDNLFIIKSDGSIILQGELDYESGKNSYKLSVQATEMSTQPLYSTVKVIIEVTNVNDNPPVFKEQEYRSQGISENVPIGTTVLTVSATDCDCGQTCHCAGGDLRYVLQKFTDTFRIDDITGEIKTIKELDYDRISEYRFQVNVYDSDERPQSGVADIVVTLENVNDNPPIFKYAAETYSITEIIQRGTILMTVQAQDLDGDPITYTIEEGDKSNFEIGEKTGVVSITTQRSPVFLKDKYVLKISASDGINKGIYTLTILIEDVNDNSPVFKSCNAYRPIIAEQAPVGTIVIKVSAVDNDRGRNGEVEYVIREPQQLRAQTLPISDFKIDNTTGVIRSNRVFDREIQKSYILLVIALDGGHGRSPAERNSASCQLEIEIQDINDHKPIFSVQKYDISIAENTPVDTVILEVSAHDEDEGKNSELMYEIKQAKLTPQFAIDKRTGSISVAMSLIGQQSLYSFQVIATDKGFPPQASSIEIDINVMRSNPPKFEKSVYKKWVSEDVTPGTLILTVNALSQTMAGSNKMIFYSILPGNLPSTNNPPSFNVDSKTGEIRTGVKLDFETLKEYVLTLMAVDERGMKSNAKVFIYVEDRNDNSPTFMLSKYEFGKITEGKAPGQIVEVVNATDIDSKLNGQVKYYLQPSPESDMFTINPDTGEIRTRVIFDREVSPKVTFHVKAEDQAAPPEIRLSSYVYVTIQITDINDNPPAFSSKQYNKTVWENKAVGSNVLELVAIDKDAGENSRLNYYIISGNEKGYFGSNSVHRASGGSIGYITVARKLDREDVSQFILKVTASDSKYNAFANVHIMIADSNDNDPQFSRSLYNATIPEDAESGIFVLRVLATDKDTPAVQSPLSYSIASGVDDYFIIDERQGTIRTGKKPFDRETKSVYTFLVFASDGTRTGSANVRVTISDVNDETPEFLDAPYNRSVQENQEPGEVVGYVTAKDKDEGQNRLIKYSLLVDAGRFTIDPNTGLIRTKVVLDRESNDNKFIIVVAATDGGEIALQGTVKVTIMVTDANDMHPYFLENMIVATVNECTYIGDEVARVRAKDNDLGINAQVMFAITNGNTPRRFRIDPDTGIITVAHILDYEKEKIYNLEISVRDKGVPQLIGKKNATVVVNLEDCNDNVPQCEMPNYIVTVLEDAQKGYVIHEIKAFDMDTGNNGMFDFFIEKASENYQFKIQSSTENPNIAVVMLDWGLDRETQQEHYLQIGIRDRGSPSKTGYCQMLVKVLDVNDNAPVFDTPDQCGMVMEEENSESQTAMEVSVIDPDGDGNQCPCMFKIVDDPSNIFEIEASSAGNKAVIRSRRGVVFDREEQGRQLYILKIAVSDGGAIAMSSETTVYIEVKDKNDNAPSSGGRLEILFNIFDNMFMGGKITPLYILDYDRTVLNVYRHVITSGQSKFLSVNSAGMIIAQQDIRATDYSMEFESTDIVRSTQVRSYVSVNVRNIYKESIMYAVSIRFAGMRKPLTCREINYMDFEGIFTEVFGFSSNVTIEVFSIQSVKDMYQTIDVWAYVYSIRIVDGRRVRVYMSRDSLIVLFYRYWKLIEERVGGRIVSIGYDACAMETGPTSECYCYNDVQVVSGFQVFTSENGMVPPPELVRAFVSMSVKVIAKYTSTPRIKYDLSKYSRSRNTEMCFNGGTVVSVAPSGYRCNCREGFEGPLCQKTCRKVEEGGYFWLPKLSVYCEGEIMFEFSTMKSSGLLLYHGPLTSFGSANMLDFLALDLIGGKLRVHMSQGERKVFVKTLSKGKRLDDGLYHHVRVYKKENFLRITVDYCNDGSSTLSGSCSYDRITDEICELSGKIPGTKRFLNGIYPLQIGYVKYVHMSYTFQPFKGFIRNIVDNGELYDLMNPLLEELTSPYCNEPELCNVVDNSRCANGGRCQGAPGMVRRGCICPKHALSGPTCEDPIPSFSFRKESYFMFTFLKKMTWYDRYTTHLKIRIRTKSDGVIYYESGVAKSQQFIILQVYKGLIYYTHSLGDGILTLIVKSLKVTTMKWFYIDMRREGTQVSITVKRGGTVVGSVSGKIGRKCLFSSTGVVFIGATAQQIIAAARASSSTTITNRFTVSAVSEVTRYAKSTTKFEGCMKFGSFYSVELFKGYDLRKIVTVRNEKVIENCTCSLPMPTVVMLRELDVTSCFAMPGAKATDYKVICVNGEWLCLYFGRGRGDDPNQKITEMGALMFLFIPLIMFTLIIIGAFAKRKMSAKPLDEPLFYDGDGKDNVMPYEDEGAGEEDFFNFELQKLVQHVGPAPPGPPTQPGSQPRPAPGPTFQTTQSTTSITNRQTKQSVQESENISSQLTKTSSTGVNVLYNKQPPDSRRPSQTGGIPLTPTGKGVSPISPGMVGVNGVEDITNMTNITETSFHSAHEQSAEELRQADIRFQRSQVETIDVALFIETRLTEADNECFSLIKDTLLHYGYEGEGSDVEDLSELDESEEGDDYNYNSNIDIRGNHDDDDFTYVRDLGPQFQQLANVLDQYSAGDHQQQHHQHILE